MRPKSSYHLHTSSSSSSYNSNNNNSSSSSLARPANEGGKRKCLGMLFDLTLIGVAVFVLGGFILFAFVDLDGSSGSGGSTPGDASGYNPNALLLARRAAAAASRKRRNGGDDNPKSNSNGNSNSAAMIWPQDFKPVISPSYSPYPQGPEILDTRGCTCIMDWREKRKSGALKPTDSVCTCMGSACAPEVDPIYLTEAEGQDVCSLRRQTGYGCTAGCQGEKVAWYGFSCGKDANDRPCPPLIVTPSGTPSGTPTTPAEIVPPKVTWNPAHVVDLRGVKCEILDGKEICFNEDTQGRTFCPSYVTSKYLREASTTGPHPVPPDIARLCGDPAYAEQMYCSVFCQDGNDHVQWWTHDVNWCYSKDGKGACPSRHPVVPMTEFTVKPWHEENPDPITPCKEAAAQGAVATSVIEELTVGMLTHEPTAFAKSLVSYEKYGFFDVVAEFIVYMNQRSPSLEAVLEPYITKYGSQKIKVLGDPTNVGIARGIVYLTGNATKPYFMLLERDFWLIEPSTCLEEQLRAGVSLLETNKVHVVRYRSQRHAGRPNWAENFFLGHEDDAFNGRQPNLACNIFYWIWNTTERWPQQFWKCGENPEFVCSDSFYCNWTNNPQMWSIKWWNEEYVTKFNAFKRNDPWWDLESYMNWEPHSWNDRGWTVAQGDGLFKHIDPTKF